MRTSLDRVQSPPRGSFFVFGPPGSGRSAWLRGVFPGAHHIDFGDDESYQAYLADPDRFTEELRGLDRRSVVIVEEIQRAPFVLAEIRRQMETRKLRFAMSGSSSRRLATGGVDPLRGRADRTHLHPLVPEELGAAFQLNDALRWGTLPAVWFSRKKKETLEAYVRDYLKDAVGGDALVRNQRGFFRFLPAAAHFHARVVNVSALSREAGVARMTAVGYLDVLEDTRLAYRLPAFDAGLRLRESKHPKLFWADAGLPRALKRQLGPPAAEEAAPLFMGWVAGLLRAYRDYTGLFDEWYHWSPSGTSGIEVPFLLRKGRKLAAVHTSAAGTLSHPSLRGLRSIRGLRGLRRRIVVHRGARRAATRDGIDVLPLRDFLDLVEEGSLLP